MPILQWLTREDDLRAAQRVPYRLLEEVSEMSSGDGDTGNLIVQGDNLEALKSLLPFFAGRVKCICIDPPYNTKSAFEHYDDNLEHTQWLAMMWPRLELLRQLLSEDGSIWVNIDDNESHYLKVVMDEVFGRKNFIVNNVWQKRYSRDGRGIIGDAHEHILCYATNPELMKQTRNPVPLGEKQRRVYKNPDNDPRGVWQSVSLLAQGYRPNQMYEIVAPNGNVHTPAEGACWKVIRPTLDALIAEGRITFGSDGNGVPRRKYYLSEADGMVPWSWWPHEDVGHTGESKGEIVELFGAEVFDTPKPERLVQRILHIATNPGDIVLDSFLGSGTTAAVAHKMGRRYIGIEMGEHATTHCVPRLRKVIDGEQGGISQDTGWQGGGGFRFYRLGPSVFDEDGRICEGIEYDVLAAHVWFSETSQPWDRTGDSPLLGIDEGIAYALLYNGILGDRRPAGGNVLTRATLSMIREGILTDNESFKGPIVIYGEQSRLSPSSLQKHNVTFKQTPYDVKVRH